MNTIFILIFVFLIIILCISSSVYYFTQSGETSTPSTPTSTLSTYQPYLLLTQNTPANDDGGGNSIYLDRHDVSCPSNSVLNTLQLIRPSDNKIQLNYMCNSSTDIGSANPKTTPMNDDGGGNSIYLDRHDISCPDNQAIGRLHLKRSGNQLQFEYDCRTVPNLGNCVMKKTDVNNDGGGNIIYLDRHNIKCDKNQVLKRLKLTRPTDKTISYEYTCCSR